MKKYIVLAAAAIATLASCTKNEVAAPSQNLEIGFKALTQKATTKAPVNSAWYGYDCPEFKIFAEFVATGSYASATPTNYLTGVCSKDETNEIWVSNPKAYWPLSGGLTFVACTPSSVNPTFADKVLTVSNFAAAGQADLMYSRASDAMDLTKDTYASKDFANYTPDGTTQNQPTTGVPVIFRHALSQIVVSARAKENQDRVSFVITSIQVKANDTATLTVDETGTAATELPSWTTPSTTSFTSDNFVKADVTLTSLASTDANATKFVNVTNEVNSIPSGIMVIPQSTANVSLIVDYKMIYNNVESTLTAPVEIKLDAAKQADGTTPVIASLVAGKKYVLDLVLSAEEIKYSPKVVDWDTQTVNQYDI